MTATETAVVVSSPSPDGGPAALVPFRGSTVLAALLDQLDRLGATDHNVLVRREWEREVRPLAGRARLVCYDGPAGLFLALGTLGARSRTEPLLVVPADTVTHDEAFADLLADPRVADAVLARSTAHEPAGLRVAGATVVSAGSSHHRVSSPNWDAPAALRVSGESRPALATAARRVAEVCRGWGAGTEAGTAADREAVALLTVALVRDGSSLAAVDLDGYPWQRPQSRDDVSEAELMLDLVDPGRLRLDNAVKADDGLFTTYLVSPYSRFVARWAAGQGLTPNQVTLVSLLVGLGAAACLAGGNRLGFVAGALLLQVSFMLDCVDGQLARYTRNFSALGAWLDATFDRAKEFAVYAGLAVGATRSGDDVWVLAALALALATFRHTVDFGYAARVRQEPVRPAVVPLTQVDDVPSGGPGTPSASDEGLHGPARDPAGPAPGHRHGARAVAWGTVGTLGRLDARSWAVWLRRVVVLPIGERWALISVTVALATPRVTFLALLVWGAFAAVYTTTGRVLRTVSR